MMTIMKHVEAKIITRLSKVLMDRPLFATVLYKWMMLELIWCLNPTLKTLPCVTLRIYYHSQFNLKLQERKELRIKHNLSIYKIFCSCQKSWKIASKNQLMNGEHFSCQVWLAQPNFFKLSPYKQFKRIISIFRIVIS